MTSYATFATASAICLVALLLLQLGTYVVGRRIGRFNIVDVTWGAGFAVVALVVVAVACAFAQRQAGAAVYVNTSDSGRGDPVKIGRKAGKGDVVALAEHGIDPGTPVWLDVELPEVWTGTQARHRAVISEHLRVLAEAGYPVGVYSAPALWREITGDARLDVPIWVGIGRSSAERAAAVCDKKVFGGREPDVVQRIGEGSDGRPLDRNLVCKGVDLAGLVRPR